MVSIKTVTMMIEPSTDLASIVRATVTRYQMLTRNETVAVAVSGGPDSTALLHLLAGLRTEFGITLVATHLNHSFRGAEADADADYVAGLCRELNVDCVVEKLDVPQAQRRMRLSAQEAARDIRHAFLRRVATEARSGRIALGHTRDDRVETILINLLRGTGAEGLGGFPAIDPPLIRPLYAVTRAQVMDYCAAYGLEPRQDSSNAKTDYARNRIRAELLPHLRSYYNEKADDAVLRMSELVTADHLVLEDLAAAFIKENARSVAIGEILLPRSPLFQLPVALQRRAVRQAIAAVRGHLQGLTFDLLAGVITSAERGDRYAITLPSAAMSAVKVSVGSDGVRIYRQEPPSSPVPWERVLAIPGVTRLEPSGIGIKAVVCDPATGRESLDFTPYIDDPIAYGTLREIVFRRRDVALPLTACSWRPGDRMRLSGTGGTKKLQDLFVDARVPASQRARRAVIRAADGTILAVVGVAAGAVALRAEALNAVRQGEGETSLVALLPYPLVVEAPTPDPADGRDAMIENMCQ